MATIHEHAADVAMDRQWRVSAIAGLARVLIRYEAGKGFSLDEEAFSILAEIVERDPYGLGVCAVAAMERATDVDVRVRAVMESVLRAPPPAPPEEGGLMAHDELAAKLRRDAIGAAMTTDAKLRREALTTAERLADVVAQVISDLDDPRRLAVHTDGLPGLVHGLSEACAKLRLLRDLDREGK